MARVVFSDVRPDDPAAGTVRIGRRVDVIAPTIPANVVATRSSGGMALTWDASSDAVGTVGYHVYRDAVLKGSPTSPAFSESGLTNGTTYVYTITAYDAAGNVSAASTPLSTTPNVPGVPGVVFDLVAAAQNGAVQLTWSHPDNGGAAITDYAELYRTGSDAYAPFSHSASTDLSQLVTGLTNGTSYDFKVAAVNSFGTGSQSSVVSATPHLINMLTANEASVETDLTGFTQQTGTISVSTDVAADGTHSLKLTQNGAVGVNARNGQITIVAGQTYTALVSVRAGATLRNAYVAIQWVASDGSTVVSTSTVAAVADSTSAWTDISSGAQVAPPGSAKARLLFGVPTATTPASAESHYFDKFGLFAGSVAAGNWVAP